MSVTGLRACRAAAPRFVIGLILAVLLSLLSLVSARPAAAASPCGPPVTSVIACENTQTGDPASDWQLSGIGGSTTQVLATSSSGNDGQDESINISTTSKAF